MIKGSRGVKLRRFTAEEIEFLKANYWDMGPHAIAERFGFRLGTVYTAAHRMGLRFDPARHKERLWNKEDLAHFYALSDPFIVYFLGYFWADGTLAKKTYNVKFKIVKPDFDVIGDRLRATAKSWRYREDHDGHPNHQVQSVLEMNHKGLWEFLVAHDYHIKSGASASKILTAIKPELRHYWWRGYFDGDGCFVFNGETVRVSICSGHKQDWSFAVEALDDLGIAYRIGKRTEGPSRNSTVNMECEASVRKFMEYILQGEQFGLQRKYDNYRRYLEHKGTCRLDKTSQFRGVTQDSRGKWVMQFYSGRHIRIGCDTETEAAELYDLLAVYYRGNKAVLNFPNAA